MARRLVPRAFLGTFVGIYAIGLAPEPEMPTKLARNAVNAVSIVKESGTQNEQHLNPLRCIGIQLVPVQEGDTLSGIQAEYTDGKFAHVVAASQSEVLRPTGPKAGMVSNENDLMPGDFALIPRACGEVQDNELVVSQ